MKKIIVLLFCASFFAIKSEAKGFNYELAKKVEILNKINSEANPYYPMVTVQLSCGSFTNYPWSNIGQIMLDMGACCPSSLNALLHDMDCAFCNNGCPEPIPYA